MNNENKHELIEIYSHSMAGETDVILWCQKCGVIVIDKYEALTGKIYPGEVMKMRFPKNSGGK